MNKPIENKAHTSPPWECEKMGADYSTIFRRRGSLIRKIAEVYHGDNDPEGMANARLITAAPKLLRAAEETLALWNKHGLGDDERESEPVYEMLREAIAAARVAVYYRQPPGTTNVKES